MPTKMEFNKMSFLVCIPPLALSKSGDGYNLSLFNEAPRAMTT